MKNINASLEEDWRGKLDGRSTAWRYWPSLLALLVLALAIILPRRLAINRPVTPDEHLWLARSANFYMALAQGDLPSTYQSEHPGVTTMWAGVAGFLIRYPQYRDSDLGQVDSNEFNRYIQNAKGVSPLELLAASRSFMILGHTLILLAGFAYASRLIGLVPAVISFLLLAFEPFHVALSRLLHLDGMLSNLLLLSLLAFLYYLESWRLLDLFASAIAAGLGLLTKLPAVLIVPVAGILIVYACWKDIAGQPGRHLSRLILPAIRIAAIWSLVALFTFVALWPAMWVRPVQTISSVLILGASHLEADADSLSQPDGEGLQYEGLSLNRWYFYPLSYLFRSTPVVLAGLALAVWAFLKKRSALSSSTRRLVLISLLLFTGTYTIALSLGEIKIDRYLLPVYPLLDIIAGLGWASLFLPLKQSVPRGLQGFAPYLAALGVTALQLVFTLNTYPYYLSYYNPLLGGIQQAQNVLPIGWGEGLDQAAQYLNKKPNAGRLVAITYFASGCFSYYFEGRARELVPRELTEDDWQKFVESDYAVIYITQRQRKLGLPILDYVSHLEPEHTVWINGLEYARIYKLP